MLKNNLTTRNHPRSSSKQKLKNLVSSRLSDHDVQKQQKKVTNNPSDVTNETPNVSEKLMTYAKKWKQLMQPFRDDNHKKFCQSNDVNYLSIPVTRIVINVDYPITFCKNVREVNVISSLLNQDISYGTTWVKTQAFTFNNYTMQNLIYKGKDMESLIFFESIIDMEWINATNRYVSNFSHRDIVTVAGYTHFSSRVVNEFIENTHSVDLLIKDLPTSPIWSKILPFYNQCIDVFKEHKDNLAQFLTIGLHEKLTKERVVPELRASFNVLETICQNKISSLITMIMTNNHPHEKIYTLLYNISPYLTLSFWKLVIKRYVDDLQNIVANAPKLTNSLVVYQVVQDQSLSTNNNSKRFHACKGFMKASLSLDYSLLYLQNIPPSELNTYCVQRITLLPGSKLLLLNGVSLSFSDVNLLFGHGSKFYITKEKTFYPISPNQICSPLKVAVTDMVLIT